MADTVDGVLIATVAAAGTLGARWLTERFQRPKISADSRKVDAETEQIIVDTAERLVGSVRTQLEQLERQHQRCQTDIEALRVERRVDRARIASLEKALRDNGIDVPPLVLEPGWRPDIARRQAHRQGDTE